MSRIQSLICADYKSIKDIILLESSFAETDKGGVGIRQVYLALSASNLFLAVDVVGGACSVVPSGRDPAREGLRLVSMFPLNCVYLTVYRQRSRNTIKLSFSEKHTSVRYFELGSCGYHDNRATHWTLWKNQIKTMRTHRVHDKQSIPLMTSPCARQNGVITIQSETSVGTSVTKSSQPMYMMSSAGRIRTLDTVSAHQEEVLCDSGHIHSVDTVNLRGAMWSSNNQHASMDFYRLAEEAVLVWENVHAGGDRKHCSGHKRCIPQSGFCFGFGLTRATRQEKRLLFVRKTKSSVSLSQDTWEPQFQLPIPKEQLVRNISQLNLHHPTRESKSSPTFWTALCFLARSPQFVYHEALRLRNWIQNSGTQGVRKPKLSGLWRKFKNITGSKSKPPNQSKEEQIANPLVLMSTGEVATKSSVRELVGTKDATETSALRDHAIDVHTKYLRETIQLKNIRFPATFNVENIQNCFKFSRHKIPSHRDDLFRIEHAVHMSDCDIQLVAQQLTLLEASLLSSIPVLEIAILANEKSMLHTPHVRRAEEFSHRIACLVASEIINTKESVQIRAKIVAKFILVADACYKLHNYQSACSILYGLQSPPVYRLAHTWSHVRKFHSRKYRLFTGLCTTLQDATLPSYVATMSDRISAHACFILPLRYLLATLVNRVHKHSTDKCTDQVKAGACDATKDRRHDCYRRTSTTCSEVNRTDHERPNPDKEFYLGQSDQQNNCQSRKFTLEVSKYRNIARAMELLLLSSSVVQIYLDSLRPNEMIDYLTKKEYKEDWVNFGLSKKLE